MKKLFVSLFLFLLTITTFAVVQANDDLVMPYAYEPVSQTTEQTIASNRSLYGYVVLTSRARYHLPQGNVTLDGTTFSKHIGLGTNYIFDPTSVDYLSNPVRRCVLWEVRADLTSIDQVWHTYHYHDY